MIAKANVVVQIALSYNTETEVQRIKQVRQKYLDKNVWNKKQNRNLDRQSTVKEQVRKESWNSFIGQLIMLFLDDHYTGKLAPQQHQYKW